MRQRGRVVLLAVVVVVLFSPPLLLLANLEVVRQSNADVCHLGLPRVPAEFFDVTDARLAIGGGRAWWGFFLSSSRLTATQTAGTNAHV